MTKQKSDEKLIKYLEEHLQYERKMIGYTYQELFSKNHEAHLSKGLRWCAMFESFGIHARNLYEFFMHKGDIGAHHYVSGHKKPNADGSPVIIKFNSSFFHLSKSRLDSKPADTEDATRIGQWVDNAWKDWVDQLPDQFKEFVDYSPVCVPLSLSVPGQQPSSSALAIFYDGDKL